MRQVSQCTGVREYREVNQYNCSCVAGYTGIHCETGQSVHRGQGVLGQRGQRVQGGQPVQQGYTVRQVVSAGDQGVQGGQGVQGRQDMHSSVSAQDWRATQHPGMPSDPPLLFRPVQIFLRTLSPRTCLKYIVQVERGNHQVPLSMRNMTPLKIAKTIIFKQQV